MIHKIICVVNVEAATEEEAKQKIGRASSYEQWFGITIEPVNFKKKLGVKDGRKDTKIKDPMPAIRTQVRRTQGTPF